ncbi:GerMN domain-containing protein [Geoalkalibacter halelectricus]|uniref:GerMN domain-containing protein n=1 Tax=Geoalkalibacter halelectricus TaxID=2847045 RepID=A0ABY5ZNN8_9BACT|nr:GerMN domain-containing protein [Geoalkalibacter halelectricus]MDO3377479.1 GerMN domain-containing protein [Geoalkalibacter halelectricus]UWZ80762.1 GerMN domain-containing protein [Geoalkalibacter halelectricus]
MASGKQRQTEKSNQTLIWALGVVTLLAVIGAAAFWAGKAGWFTPASRVAEVSVEAPLVREIILYFADSQGEFLIAEQREIADCPDNEQCVRAVVEALIKGAHTDLIPVLPPQTRVLGVVFEDETVTVDFSRDLVTRHPGGSVSELLTVYGLANTLAVNFPHLRQVRILIAGQAVESLKGHVDLRAPVPADFRYGRPPLRIGGADDPSGASPQGRMP